MLRARRATAATVTVGAMRVPPLPTPRAVLSMTSTPFIPVRRCETTTTFSGPHSSTRSSASVISVSLHWCGVRCGQVRGDELGEVASDPVGGLGDLRAAAKPVGEHCGGRGGGANGGKQDLLASRDRDVVVTAFETEVARQAAASGVEHLVVDPGRSEQCRVGSEAGGRVLVAMGL